MKLGIVGAGLIVRTLLEFIHELPEIELVAISGLPVDEPTLIRWKEEHGFRYTYLDYSELLANEEVDTIYIGVNNHLHYRFAKQALLAGKHVILEKPFTSNYRQACRLKEIAEEKGLMIFEAISTVHNPNFVKIEELLPTLGDIKVVSLNYTQYSSRYDAFMEGNILPAFNYKMSGGALMDLNIYNIHFITQLFGAPNDVHYIANMEKGIDTSGILTMEYDTFQAVLIGAKDCGAPLLNCVQGNKGCIYTSSPMFTLTHFEYQLNKTEPVHYDLTNHAHRMKHEFIDFLKIFNEKDLTANRKALQHSLDVMSVVTKARQDIGLIFPDDENL
ncbi:MAG: Gfo/Idh/MocA family oxidoreductase [Erysipelotrichaceae bacterium]|nr:Gfo/Idh/MocA family oxidoreductase [Erysipelotrichaceae bacterium]